MGKRQSARLRVLIRRCRIKAAFNTSSDKGLELRVTHALHVDCGGGFELSRHQRCNHAHKLDGMRNAKRGAPSRS